MSKFDGVQVGDRVRVVIESEVTRKTAHGSITTAAYNGFQPDQDDIVSVEVLAPPVTVFNPGEVVRHKSNGSMWLILNDGYVRLGSILGSAAKPQRSNPAQFTSEDYELVELDV